MPSARFCLTCRRCGNLPSGSHGVGSRGGGDSSVCGSDDENDAGSSQKNGDNAGDADDDEDSKGKDSTVRFSVRWKSFSPKSLRMRRGSRLVWIFSPTCGNSPLIFQTRRASRGVQLP